MTTALKVQVKIPASQATFDLPAHLGPLPTAEELSEPGALQRYVDTCGTVCKLPAGKIAGNVVIKSDSVTLEGAGEPYGTRITGTVLVPADPTKPAITVRNAVGVTIKSLGISGGEIGVSLEGSVGALVLHTKLVDVATCDTALPVRVSEPPGTRKGQHAAADVVIDHCRFTRFKRDGVEVNHPQSVNIHVIGQTYFYQGENAVTVNDGGRVLISDCCCNNLGTWLRLHKGGGNLVPSVLRNLYSDRTGGAAAPIIVDARNCPDRIRVLVDVYSCPYLSSDGPWAEVKHRHFYAPDGSKDAAANSIIKIADPDFFNAAGSTEGAQPQGVGL